MEKGKRLGFGKRGTLLIIVLFISFMCYQVFTNYSLNILADFYGGTQSVAQILTAGTLVGVVLQIILSVFVGKMKSIKRVAAVVGLVAIVSCIICSAVPVQFGEFGPQCTMLGLWKGMYFVVNLATTMFVLFFLSIITGQWFPTRKGTVMGIATIAFPFSNGVLGFFANTAMSPLATGQTPAILKAFAPFLIAYIIGYVIFLVFVTDYPEQCGAYRDNNINLSPEVAKAMMEEEIQNKRTTVWTAPHIFGNRDFWCASISCGLILMSAVGVMQQTNAIIGAFPALDFTKVMMAVAIFGAIGSWLLGVIDTAIGTKKSMLIAIAMMIVSGILGVVSIKSGIGVLVIVSLMLIAMFMGASSNYTVSVAAQYWRREDFASIFACLNPVANLLNAVTPVIVAIIISSVLGITGIFIYVSICGVLAVVLMMIFNKKHIKAVDDKYRQAAGKPLNDALADRK